MSEFRLAAPPPAIEVLAEPSERAADYRGGGRYDGPLVMTLAWSRFAARRTLVRAALGGGLYALIATLVILTEGPAAGMVVGALALLGLVVAGYYALAEALNRLTIAVDDEQIRWKHGPLPMIRAGAVPSSEIRQLRISRVGRGDDVCFGLAIVTAGDEKRMLVPESLSVGADKASVDFLAEQIENRLSLTPA